MMQLDDLGRRHQLPPTMGAANHHKHPDGEGNEQFVNCRNCHFDRRISELLGDLRSGRQNEQRERVRFGCEEKRVGKGESRRGRELEIRTSI